VLKTAKTKGGRPLHTWDGLYLTLPTRKEGDLDSDPERRGNWKSCSYMEDKLLRTAAEWIVGFEMDSCIAILSASSLVSNRHQ
jgi:hypothetical protein